MLSSEKSTFEESTTPTVIDTEGTSCLHPQRVDSCFFLQQLFRYNCRQIGMKTTIAEGRWTFRRKMSVMSSIDLTKICNFQFGWIVWVYIKNIAMIRFFYTPTRSSWYSGHTLHLVNSFFKRTKVNRRFCTTYQIHRRKQMQKLSEISFLFISSHYHKRARQKRIKKDEIGILRRWKKRKLIMSSLKFLGLGFISMTSPSTMSSIWFKIKWWILIIPE
jgi:hypothetical protein